jgi:hypothetical protein
MKKAKKKMIVNTGLFLFQMKNKMKLKKKMKEIILKQKLSYCSVMKDHNTKDYNYKGKHN